MSNELDDFIRSNKVTAEEGDSAAVDVLGVKVAAKPEPAPERPADELELFLGRPLELDQ